MTRPISASLPISLSKQSSVDSLSNVMNQRVTRSRTMLLALGTDTCLEKRNDIQISKQISKQEKNQIGLGINTQSSYQPSTRGSVQLVAKANVQSNMQANALSVNRVNTKLMVASIDAALQNGKLGKKKIDTCNFIYAVMNVVPKQMKVCVRREKRKRSEMETAPVEVEIKKRLRKSVQTLQYPPARSRSASLTRRSSLIKAFRPSSPIAEESSDDESLSGLVGTSLPECFEMMQFLSDFGYYSQVKAYQFTDDQPVVTFKTIDARVQNGAYLSLDAMKQDILTALDGLIMFTPLGSEIRECGQKFYKYYLREHDGINEVTGTNPSQCNFIFSRSVADKFECIDAVSIRLGRRGGKTPFWYPTSWRRNIRKACKFFYKDDE